MNKTELESKHIAELHALAAEAGIPRYRMLRREELVEQLSDGKSGGGGKPDGGRKPSSQRRERPQRSRRERSGGERPPRERPERPAKAEETPEPAAAPPPEAEPTSAAQPEPSRPKRKRRRRFGRRSKGLRLQDLLTPPPGRQALVYGDDRTACTALLRELAGELADTAEGPDPIALLVDPSPEELADWKREAPQAELVVAAQARHASDALGQAVRRAESGEDITLLVDSLTRLKDPEAAKKIFDGGLTTSPKSGSLTIVAALERQA